jgi:hypothetical protein
MLAQELQPEARRVALAVVWGRYGEDDARRELRGWLAIAADRARFKVRCGELASEMLEDELALLEASYRRTFWQIRDGVLHALRTGQRDRVEETAGDIASQGDPPPPIWIVHRAIDLARVQHTRQLAATVRGAGR